MNLMCILSLLVSFICCWQPVYPLTAVDTGTLIVSYQTGSRGERLNRVRFLLSSEGGDDQIYPKGNAFVEDEDDPSRMVAIEDLPVGKYALKFLIPNQDGLFEDIPERRITITKNSVVKVDQSIHPRYATVKATISTIPENCELKTMPIITLRDKFGHACAHSKTGKLVTHSLAPGMYTLDFEPLSGYHAPDPVTLELAADQISGPVIGNYVHETAEPPFSAPIAQSIISTPQGRSNLIITQVFAKLTVNTNLPDAHWKLMRRDEVVYQGVGPEVNLQVPEGDKYSIVPEEIEGYSVKVNPFGTFNIYVSQTTRVDIFYERLTGSINLQAPFPEGETLSLKIIQPDKLPPIHITIKARGDKILWSSPLLPTGKYEVHFILPPAYEPVPPQQIIIAPREVTRLTPELIKGATLHVTANVPEAIFLLRTGKDSQAWKGEGREFTFQGLPAGGYQLSFSTQDQDFFIPPKDIKIFLKEMEIKEINATFELKGKLVVNTNVDRSQIMIQELGGKRQSYKEEILGNSKTFSLPEGKYRITASPIQGNTAETLKFITPEPIEVVLKPFKTEQINLSFKAENVVPPEKQRKVSVSLNVAGGYTIFMLKGSTRDSVGHYSGKSNQVVLPAADRYEIIFDDVPNFQTPDKVSLEVPLGETKTVQATYSPLQGTVLVPAGRAIIGDATSEEKINERPAKVVQISAFSIGTYEVTNEQFSTWLSQAIKAGNIFYENEGDKRGQVFDGSGHLICKTFEADPYSQISAQLHSLQGTLFLPIAGKDIYPVINVSWYGADAYCKDNNCRLPTEAEWEKAAGMEPEKPGKPLKKFIFGFSQDHIDRTWANYKENPNPVQHFQVLTTPVGFYNGMNYLPLTVTSNIQQQVHLAKSPYGAFDMSGNVWEWVADWYDPNYYKNASEKDPKGPPTGTMKVVKGGCYDSLADGVRVAERLALPPDHVDVFTGFRIAK